MLQLSNTSNFFFFFFFAREDPVVYSSDELRRYRAMEMSSTNSHLFTNVCEFEAHIE